jgi:hypothetical protein
MRSARLGFFSARDYCGFRGVAQVYRRTYVRDQAPEMDGHKSPFNHERQGNAHRVTVAKVLGDTPTIAIDRLRRRAMVVGNDLPPLLRIEVAGDLSRTDEIAKKYRQMAALAYRRFAWFAAFDDAGGSFALG